MSIHYTNTSNPIDFPKQSTVDRLWGEALDKAVPDTYSSLTWTQVEKIKQEFAMLIVGECIEVFSKDLPEDSGKMLEVVNRVCNVADHFGVKV